LQNLNNQYTRILTIFLMHLFAKISLYERESRDLLLSALSWRGQTFQPLSVEKKGDVAWGQVAATLCRRRTRRRRHVRKGTREKRVASRLHKRSVAVALTKPAESRKDSRPKFTKGKERAVSVKTDADKPSEPGPSRPTRSKVRTKREIIRSVSPGTWEYWHSSSVPIEERKRMLVEEVTHADRAEMPRAEIKRRDKQREDDLSRKEDEKKAAEEAARNAHIAMLRDREVAECVFIDHRYCTRRFSFRVHEEGGLELLGNAYHFRTDGPNQIDPPNLGSRFKEVLGDLDQCTGSSEPWVTHVPGKRSERLKTFQEALALSRASGTLPPQYVSWWPANSHVRSNVDSADLCWNDPPTEEEMDTDAAENWD